MGRQGVKLAEFERVTRVRQVGVVAGVAQLAIGDQRASIILDEAVGAFIACDLLSDRAGRVDLGKEGGEVGLGIKVAESGDERLGAQRGKRRGIGKGGGAVDHGMRPSVRMLRC